MKLLTKALLNKLPKLYETEKQSIDETMLYVKLFTPWSNWTWYIAEYDPEDRRAFGLVEGFEKEWGYFCMDELESIRGVGGLKIERDKYFTPKLAKDLKD